MTAKSAVRKERILEYLDNIQRQMKDIRSISVSGQEFFLERKNAIEIKPIKYSLACAIQDLTRICAHIASALSLWKVWESESEAILGLADAGILPKEFAERMMGMPAFRNRIIHDYCLIWNSGTIQEWFHVTVHGTGHGQLGQRA